MGGVLTPLTPSSVRHGMERAWTDAKKMTASPNRHYTVDTAGHRLEEHSDQRHIWKKNLEKKCGQQLLLE